MAKKKKDEEMVETAPTEVVETKKKTSKKAEPISKDEKPKKAAKVETVEENTADETKTTKKKIAKSEIVEAPIADVAPEKKTTTKKKAEVKIDKAEEVKIEEKIEEVAQVEAEAKATQAATTPVAEEYDGPRFNDDELEEFRVRIMELRHEAMDELRMLRERLEDYTNYDFAEESMIYSMHMAEQGPEALEQEKTYAQVQRISEYIKKLDDALQRIKDKTFGVCRVCKCLIAKERLLAVPITTLSAAYKIHKKCPADGIDRIEPLKK
jgi:RNA polymerase-binding transcription factor DksA